MALSKPPSPDEVAGHIAAEYSRRILQIAQATAPPTTVPQRKKRRTQKTRSSSNSHQSRGGKKPKGRGPASASEVNPMFNADQIPPDDMLMASHDEQLQELRGNLASRFLLEVPFPPTQTSSVWAERRLKAGTSAKSARPVLLEAKLSARRALDTLCQKCKKVGAHVRCLDCVPLGTEYTCGACDTEVHGKNIFHDRVAVCNGYLQALPPTTVVVVEEDGQPHFHEQVCHMPMPTQGPICVCSQDTVVTTTWKRTTVVTMNGRYDVYLPRKFCPTCAAEWTPGVKDLLQYHYWPSTSNFQTLYRFEVFEAFESLKVAAPALSRSAFLSLLEHQSLQAGRHGKICADTFQKSYFEYCLCKHTEDQMCDVDNFKCPACEPNMLAICCDGNRKLYRFAKSNGAEDPMYEGLFIAKDEDVSEFLVRVRGSSTTTHANTCGVSTFKASKETSRKSSSKIDIEGLQVAVCRHGILLRALNHYRGEVMAYPMFLHKELSERVNLKFFCMDVICRYWPYLYKVAETTPELQPLLENRPFLSVMHAKAHTAKCEVRWGGRSQDGAGNTVGEEVEQVNSFLSRAALITKFMTKAGREDMLTQQAMGWNQRKTTTLHKALAQRYIKISERATKEGSSLSEFLQNNAIDEETAQQWVTDVKKWAVTKTGHTPGETDDLREKIENITVTLLRMKQDLHRQNDGNKIKQKKRRKMRDLRKKLRERVLEYNDATVEEEDKIDVELACDSTEDYILPWEIREDGNSFRLKRSLYDQTMLVKRLKEERSILVQEMSQHIISLRSELKGVGNVLKSDLGGDMSEDAIEGLKSALRQRSAALDSSLKQAVSTYCAIVDNLFIPDTDCSTDDEDIFSSPDSEEDEEEVN